jgi:hypothetical protein
VRSRGVVAVSCVVPVRGDGAYETPVTAGAISQRPSTPRRVEGAAQKDESRPRSQMQREGSNLQKARNF